MKNQEFNQFEKAHLNKITAKSDRAKKLERDKLERDKFGHKKNNK